MLLLLYNPIPKVLQSIINSSTSVNTQFQAETQLHTSHLNTLLSANLSVAPMGLQV